MYYQCNTFIKPDAFSDMELVIINVIHVLSPMLFLTWSWSTVSDMEPTKGGLHQTKGVGNSILCVDPVQPMRSGFAGLTSLARIHFKR